MTTPSAAQPSRCARALRRADVARRLRAAFAQHDVSYAVAALAVGTGKARVAEWCDPEEAATLSIADALALPPAVLRALLAPLAESVGLALVALPAASRSTCAKAAAQLAREAGEVIADAYKASADGVVTPAEGASLERQCDDALAALLEVREHARAAQRVGVVPLRRRAGA